MEEASRRDVGSEGLGGNEPRDEDVEVYVEAKGKSQGTIGPLGSSLVTAGDESRGLVENVFRGRE